MLLYELLQDLEPYAPRLLGQTDDRTLTELEPLPPAGQPLEEDVLYLALPPVSMDHLSQPVHLLCPGPVSPEAGHIQAAVLSLDHPPDTRALIDLIRARLRRERRLADFSAHLLDLLTKNASVQQVVDWAYQQLHNPVFVFDAGFSLVAANWNAVIYDPDAKHFIENRYLTPEDMRAINFDQIHQRAMRSDHPVLVRNPNYSTDRIVARLSIQHKNVGHIVMTATNRPLRDSDYQAMEVLQNVISQQFQRDSFIRNSRGLHYEHLICDLLDGKIPLGKQLQDRMAYVDLHFQALNYLTVAELARTPRYVNPGFIRSQFERLLPGSRTILYRGQILLLTTRGEDTPVTREELDAFARYCRDNDLYCGMSNPFQRVSQLPQFYQQALRALELGAAGGPSLCRYEDYACEHVAALFRAKESPEVFCHPALGRLKEYDRLHHTQLTATLYHFLRCERNAVRTAQEMFLHRNTLGYRLKQILALTNLDLDDPDTRQYLSLSLLVDQSWNHG